MRILLINASPRQGNSLRAAMAVVERIKNSVEVELDVLDLKGLELPFCTGCQACFLRGESRCPHAGVVMPIEKRIRESDALIIASPSYALDIPGSLKTIFDHLAWRFHRPYTNDRSALVIATTLGAGAAEGARYMRRVLGYWGFTKVETVSLALHAMEYSGEYPALNKKADRFARRLKRGPYDPSLGRVAMYNCFRASARGSGDEANADFRYWKDGGLLDVPYHHPIPIWKALPGRATHRLFLKLFSPQRRGKP